MSTVMTLFVDTKYIHQISFRLRNFKQKSQKLWNFSCPICGDSQRNKTKARGYIYEVKNHLNFNEVIKCIKKIGIKSVLVESGIKFNKFLLDSNLLNDFYHFYTEKHLKRNGIYNAKSFFLRLNKIKKKREKIIVNLLDDKLDKYMII